MAIVSEPIAVVSGLSVTYRVPNEQPVRALSQATLAIARGERIGILGESGSGKSTLAAAVMRLLPPHARYDGGSVRFQAVDLLALPETQLRRIRGKEIALIPQDPSQALNPVISVGDQIAEVLRAHLRMARNQRRTRVEELLSEVGFDHPYQIYGSYPHELSGGQRQRVVIAQAVACCPNLVIADEPTSKLDASLKADILALIQEIGQRYNTAFVLITHDPTVLAGFADRIAVMYAGRVIEEGSVRDIFSHPLHPYTQALIKLSGRYLASAPTRERWPIVQSALPEFANSEKGCSFASRCPERMQVCTERDPQETTARPSHRVSCFKYD